MFLTHRNCDPIVTVTFKIRRRVSAKIEIADRLREGFIGVPCGHHSALISLVWMALEVEQIMDLLNSLAPRRKYQQVRVT